MSGPITPPLTVETVDGATEGRPITTIKVSNGDLTISGNTATIDTSGSGGTAAGSDTEIQINDGGAFGASSNLTFASNTLTVENAIDLGSTGTGGRLECTQDGQDLQIKHTGSGAVVIKNLTNNNDTNLNIVGPGSGDANIVMSSTSGAGGITFPDGTEQTTAATGGAPADAEYLLAFDATIPSELTAARKLTIGANISFAHGAGANDDVVIYAKASKVGATVDGQIQWCGPTSDFFAASSAFYFDNTNTRLHITGGEVDADIVRIGSGTSGNEVTTNTTENLILNTNTGTNSGSITINNGLNANINLSPNGSGQNRLISETVIVGDGTAHAFISSNGAYDLVLETREGADSPTIRLVHGVNGGITLTPAGTGAVSIGGNYNLPTAVTTTNDYVLTAQTDGSTAWAEAGGGGGASELSDLTDVLIDATNFTDGFLIQPNSNGAAPTTGTLNSAEENTGLGKDVFKALENADYCTMYGSRAGESITTGSYNTGIGRLALYQVSVQTFNTALGYYSGAGIQNGAKNLAIGYNTLGANMNGEGNTALGTQALTATTGDYNIGIGYSAGDVTSGSNNVVIGGANVDDATADDQLVISSGDGTPFWVKGDSSGSCYQGDNASTWSTTSDERLKTNIVDSPKGLEEIKSLKVRNFNYIEKATPITEEIENNEGEIEERIIGYDGENRYNLDPEPLRTGFIAQELEVILPEAVKENLHGHKTVDIDPVIYSLINAVQELSAKVETLEAMIE